ncbi:hypothetical protein FRC12_000346 [Ceratobasidium sp. 428]|nr:hypothetical protein FRC12_000346 [Ceratobasidium sp. 428]
MTVAQLVDVWALRGGTSAGCADHPSFPISQRDTLSGLDALAPARQGYLWTQPTNTTCILHPPPFTLVKSIMITPASATTISPVSPVRTRFGFPMIQPPALVVLGEGSQLARAPEAGMDELVDVTCRPPDQELRLLPIRTLPPIQTYGQGLETVSAAEQTRRAMHGGGAGISHDVLLYGPAGVTPASTDSARSQQHARQASAYSIERAAPSSHLSRRPERSHCRRVGPLCNYLRPLAREFPFPHLRAPFTLPLESLVSSLATRAII